MIKINQLLANASLLTLLPMAASAALITWSPSVDMYADGVGVDGDDSFVNNSTGSFVLAYSGTDASTAATGTLNGVTFGQADEVLLTGAGYTGGGVTVTLSNGRSTGTAYNTGSFATGGDIENLLDGGVFDAATLTLSGLIIGDTYILQIFTNDARTGGTRSVDWQVGFSDGTQSFDDSYTANTHGASDLNNRASGGGGGELSGDSIIGTFVASDTTQSFEYRGTRDNWVTQTVGTGQINGLQLRTIPVPEPSSAALLGLGGLALILRRRK